MIDFLWPRTCAVRDCGRKMDRAGYICSRCYASLPWFDDCPSAAFAYLADIPELIGIYKFNNGRYLADGFADAMELAIRKKHPASEIDLVVPVPLHPKRLAERGFNQSALLAEKLAARLNRACNQSALTRLRDTPHQSRSTGDERRKQIAAAFRATDASQIRGRTILLIDDVATTGATLDECTSALRTAGAYRVIPFTLAKALLDEDLDGH